MIRAIVLTALVLAAISLSDAQQVLAPTRSAAFMAVSGGGGGGASWLVSEDAEGTGTLSGWTDSGGINWDSTTSPLVGAQSVRYIVSQNTYKSWSAVGEVWVFFSFRIDDFSNNPWLFSVRDASGTMQWHFKVLSSGSVEMYDAGDNYRDGTDPISAATQYYLWARCKKGTGANAECDLWIDTTTTKPGAVSATTTAGTSTADLGQVFFGTEGNVATVDVDYIRVDDVSIGSAP